MTEWDQLAQQCRELATLAEQTRDQLAVMPAMVTGNLRVSHERIDEAAREVQRLAGACRRRTYLTLRLHLSVKEIATAFGAGTHAVHKVLRGRSKGPVPAAAEE